MRIEFAGAFRGFGIWILNLLTFVKNRSEPFDAGKFFTTDSELSVVENEHVDFILDVFHIDIIAVLENFDSELRSEFLCFAIPDIKNGFRTDDECGFVRGAGLFMFIEEPQKIGEGLDGFTKTHVIGKDTTEVIF